MKKCYVCGTFKDLDSFHKDKNSLDGHTYKCKECAKGNSRKWYKNNKDRARASYKERYARNKDEIIKKVKEWCAKNPDKRFAIHRRWYEEHKEEQKERNCERSNNKRSHINDLARKYQSFLRQNPKWRITKNISRGISKSIACGKNGMHWEAIVGYNASTLIAYLENLFCEGMTWDNYGKAWHIDHIIPISAFNFSSTSDIDFKRCWSLKNLRPLWAVDNLRKGDLLEKPFQPSLTIGE